MIIKKIVKTLYNFSLYAQDFFVVILSIHSSLKEIEDTCLEPSLETNICKYLYQKKDEGNNWFGFLKTDGEFFWYK